MTDVTTARRRSTGSPTGQARKELILRSAAKVFAEKGFSNATVRDIADEADMLSGSLYYYFDSKESMVEAVLVEYLDDVMRSYATAVQEAGQPAEALERLLGIALRALAKSRQEVMILQNDWHYVRPLNGIESRNDQIERIWLDVIQAGIEAGELRGDVDARMIYRTLMGAVLAVSRWFDPRGKVSIEEVVRVQTALLLYGSRAAAH